MVTSVCVCVCVYMEQMYSAMKCVPRLKYNQSYSVYVKAREVRRGWQKAARPLIS